MKKHKNTFNAKYINIQVNGSDIKHDNICFILNKQKMFWNFRIPLYITPKGNIKEKNYNKVLDNVRSSFGIDLTKLEKSIIDDDSILRLKENLSNKIKDIKEEIKENKRNATKVEKLNKELEKAVYESNTLKNKNNTLIKYELRRKYLEGYSIERYLASFLLVTGQVVYDEKARKYVYNYFGNSVDEGLFTIVSEYKSYNKKEPFTQLVFSYLYDIPAKYRNKFKNNRWTLKQGIKNERSLKNNKKIFKKIPIKYNLMYSKYLLNKVLKISKVLSIEDTEDILISLYEFKMSLINKDKEDKNLQLINVMSNWINVFSLCLREDIDKPTFKNKVKKLFEDNNSFKLIYKNIFKFKGLFSNYFVTKKSFNDFKDFVENNYITNKKVKEDYVAKTYFEEKVKEYENKITELLNQIKRNKETCNSVKRN